MKSNPFPLRLSLLSAVALLVAFGPSSGYCVTLADFSGGNGTTQANQFKGTTGDGWAGAWNSRSGSGGTSTFSVENTNPFDGGGNYLQIDYARTQAGDSNRAGVSRKFLNSGPGSLDMTQPYTLSFDFRVDSLTGWSSSGDQFAFSSESTTTIGSFGADAPWALLIRGDTGWIATNGNGVGGVASSLNFSSLGLTALATNTVYSITAYIDPTKSGYDLTIRTGGVTYRASDLNGGQLLGFRTDSTAANANVLQFRATTDGASDEVKWSLDNVAVVPEPGSVALFLSAAVCLALTARRRV